MVLCWFSHQAQLQRGMLSTGTEESFWLWTMAEFFTSEPTFSWSEPPSPPPFPQVCQKQWLPQLWPLLPGGPRRVPAFLCQAQCSGLCPSYWLTLLVWHPQHPVRTWCFIQRKISLIASSQEKSDSNWWITHGMSSRVLILLLLSVVFPSCLSQRNPSHSSSVHEEKIVSERKLGIANI